MDFRLGCSAHPLCCARHLLIVGLLPLLVMPMAHFVALLMPSPAFEEVATVRFQIQFSRAGVKRSESSQQGEIQHMYIYSYIIFTKGIVRLNVLEFVRMVYL